MSDKRFLVMVNQANRENLNQVSERLVTIGCKVEREMDKLGIIAISANEDHLTQVQKVEGVSKVTSGDDQFYAV